MEFKDLEAMTETHECTQCGAPLVVVHADGAEAWILKCGQDKTHTGIKKREATTTAIARGKADKRLGSGAQKSLEKTYEQSGLDFSLAAKKDVGSGDVITVPAFTGLVKWARLVGLNAYLGHVCLYYGEPYVTIDGFYYLLETRKTEIHVGTKPLNSEAKVLYGIPESAYAWLAEAWLGTTKLPESGLGIITQEEIDAPSKRDPEKFRAPIAHDKPQRMAEKRAEWQLLRKIVPLHSNEPAPAGEERRQ